ncbi:hypothetical protein B0H14DRAFT_3147137 [Mycena olivaceomarginata]|nr:hypothetical protein B0H14DRAFT_3147137 [Mycena olivaceomarginata]
MSRNLKEKKLPACDTCKARRVLCIPQPGGAPCRRCVERNSVCITTPIARGRPRKNPVAASSSLSLPLPQSRASLPFPLYPLPVLENTSDCPELNSEFVAHCFEGLKFTPQYTHPLISATSIKTDIRAASFQIHLLPPQSRVLALCIVCFVSLTSFHPSVLGDGPRPESFLDHDFFSSQHSRLLECGKRRAPAFRALRAEALKGAWEIGIMLQPSSENAASCYLLDLTELDNLSSVRPWANAYIAHVRALVPIWRTSGYITSDAGQWAGFLMTEALISARTRTTMLVTLNDQLLICGPEPPPLESLLASVENSPQSSGLAVLWTSMKPYLFHVTYLARELSEKIAGDYARVNPLSEGAVIKFLFSLSLMHSVLSLLLDRIDAAITSATANDSPFILEDTNMDVVARACAYAVAFGFTGLVLPFYRELEHRENSENKIQNQRTHDRLRLLRAQAHDMAVQGAREVVRSLRYLPKIHYTPVHWATISSWAEFCAEMAESGTALSPESALDLETIANELKLLGYSLDVASAPHGSALIERLEAHVHVNASLLGPASGLSDPTSSDLLDPTSLAGIFPLSGPWIEPMDDEQLYQAVTTYAGPESFD